MILLFDLPHGISELSLMLIEASGYTANTIVLLGMANYLNSMNEIVLCRYDFFSLLSEATVAFLLFFFH